MSSGNGNPWKGLVLGAVGGVVGAMAMEGYWKVATALTGKDPREASGEMESDALDSISLVGTHHREDESSTAAVGRIAYQTVTGKQPSEETKTTLSWAVHYIFSASLAALYGAVRGKAEPPDAVGGSALGTGLWLFGDELVMPLLGLTKGPTAYPTALHLHSWAAHIVYGIASSAATQVLNQLLSDE